MQKYFIRSQLGAGAIQLIFDLRMAITLATNGKLQIILDTVSLGRGIKSAIQLRVDLRRTIVFSTNGKHKII